MKHAQVSTAELTKQKKGYQKSKIINEIKREAENREKSAKRNEQSLQEM